MWQQSSRTPPPISHVSPRRNSLHLSRRARLPTKRGCYDRRSLLRESCVPLSHHNIVPRLRRWNVATPAQREPEAPGAAPAGGSSPHYRPADPGVGFSSPSGSRVGVGVGGPKSQPCLSPSKSRMLWQTILLRGQEGRGLWTHWSCLWNGRPRSHKRYVTVRNTPEEGWGGPGRVLLPPL